MEISVGQRCLDIGEKIFKVGALSIETGGQICIFKHVGNGEKNLMLRHCNSKKLTK